ncbi:hypothetical protein [Propionivibrio dicarboxylicus]|uniref:hypothetical protein n=1 Tax=Propionivibrio dicarboxylicus TaxID=83767 RepID=UPI000B849F5B|nr:hypothetical protein [Propionivibrio dicarboxylicus]
MPGVAAHIAPAECPPNLSVSNISAQTFVGVTTLACGGYIKAPEAGALIYVSGWRQVRRRFSTPLYSDGHLPDIEQPAVDDGNRKAPGMERILETLERFRHLTNKNIIRHSGSGNYGPVVQAGDYLLTRSLMHKPH